MQAVILAGGIGTRLRPITYETPKSLISVCGKPFVQYQVELLRRHALTDILLCLKYKAAQIRRFLGDGSRFGVRISYSYDGEEPKGTAGALKGAAKKLEEEFIMMNGDSYVPVDFALLMRRFHDVSPQAMMVVYKNYNRYDKSNVVLNDGLIVKYSRKERPADMVYIDAGVTLFHKSVLDLIPDGCFYPLDKVYLALIERRQLRAFETKRRFYEIGSFEGLKDFGNYVRNLPWDA